MLVANPLMPRQQRTTLFTSRYLSPMVSATYTRRQSSPPVTTMNSVKIEVSTLPKNNWIWGKSPKLTSTGPTSFMYCVTACVKKTAKRNITKHIITMHQNRDTMDPRTQLIIKRNSVKNWRRRTTLRTLTTFNMRSARAKPTLSVALPTTSIIVTTTKRESNQFQFDSSPIKNQ